MLIKSQGSKITRTILMQRKEDGKLHPVIGASVEDNAQLFGVTYEISLDAFLANATAIGVLEDAKLAEFIQPRKHTNSKADASKQKLAELGL